MNRTTELFLLQAGQLVDDVKPHFAGQHPAVVAVALSELFALHLASTPPDTRDAARAEFMRAVDNAIPECERKIFPDGLPAEWRR
jgi:hypothetical protein